MQAFNSPLFYSILLSFPLLLLLSSAVPFFRESFQSDIRVCIKLREMVFRGVASTAMIYDSHPIFDHFRYVNEDMVLGVMDAPKLNMGGFFYFFLTRYKK